MSGRVPDDVPVFRLHATQEGLYANPTKLSVQVLNVRVPVLPRKPIDGDREAISSTDRPNVTELSGDLAIRVCEVAEETGFFAMPSRGVFVPCRPDGDEFVYL